MTPLKKGMAVQSVEGLPRLPENGAKPVFKPVAETSVDVLIIGGGPAGLSAAIELGMLGISTLIVDDKDRLGGKLVLQTHKFFGSVEDSHAGTRGFEIGNILERQLKKLSSVEIWTRPLSQLSSMSYFDQKLSCGLAPRVRTGVVAAAQVSLA